MIMPHLPGKYKEVLSCLICARSCWTWMRTGEGLYAVSDYLYEVQEKMRGDLDLCLAQVREN